MTTSMINRRKHFRGRWFNPYVKICHHQETVFIFPFVFNVVYHRTTSLIHPASQTHSFRPASPKMRRREQPTERTDPASTTSRKKALIDKFYLPFQISEIWNLYAGIPHLKSFFLPKKEPPLIYPFVLWEKTQQRQIFSFAIILNGKKT